MFHSGSCEHPQSAIRERQPERASGDAQQQTFEQQLARDASPPGAERGANRQFLPASIGADQKQIRHVGAGDQ